MEIVLAILIGTSFGFILQRVGAADPEKIVGMLKLQDLHLMKVILSGIGISSFLLFGLLALGIVDPGHLSIKGMSLGVILGGVLLGFGWAVAGYCPGTGVVAAGTGRKDSLFFIVGGLLGAGAFTVLYEVLASTGMFADMFGGKVTLVQTGVEPALVNASWSPVLALGIGLAFVAIAFLLPDKE